MWSSSRAASLAALIATFLMVGCGGESESAVAAPAVPTVAVSPWDSIPRDSLYGATASEIIRTVPVELEVMGLAEGWDSVSIAAISDFQLGLWEDNAEVAAAAVRQALSTDPDLVVLLGDYIARGSDTEELRRVLAPLSGRTTVAVLGDRDIRTDSLEANIVRTLRSLGIRVLRNEKASFIRDGDTLSVVGLAADIASESFADREWILATLAGGERTPLLLSHLPGAVVGAPEGGFPGILAGGTLCSDVEVPGTPRLSWLNSEVLPNALVEGQNRLYLLEGNALFVTCGVGYSFIPVRLGHPPEVVLLTLHRAAAPAEEAESDSVARDSLLRQFELQDTTGN
ncbi:MAG TPA: metallophosphoesterase [Longimicrobiaceae bacterium]|nr:metallophosphoesterase [Longimicrobiaceae bacterium]